MKWDPDSSSPSTKNLVTGPDSIQSSILRHYLLQWDPCFVLFYFYFHFISYILNLSNDAVGSSDFNGISNYKNLHHSSLTNWLLLWIPFISQELHTDTQYKPIIHIFPRQPRVLSHWTDGPAEWHNDRNATKHYSFANALNTRKQTHLCTHSTLTINWQSYCNTSLPKLPKCYYISTLIRLTSPIFTDYMLPSLCQYHSSC
jgi:hypothetical protein